MLRRGKCQEAARQADQGLGVEVVGIVRLGEMIGDAVADLRQAGGVRIAEIADLDRRRPGGAREQAAVLGEAGQLDGCRSDRRGSGAQARIVSALTSRQALASRAAAR
jgi:hypothetical protein